MENEEIKDTTEIEDAEVSEVQIESTPVSMNPGHTRTAAQQMQWVIDEHNLSQKEAAKILKTSQGNISEILKGSRNVSVKQAECLCLRFGGVLEDWRDTVLIRKKQKKHKMKNGIATTTISIGQAKTIGEGSPENPVVIKEKLAPKEFTHSRNAEVSLSYGVTKSLGNFEFIRIDVSVKDFCESERKQECWDRLDKEVLTRLEKALASVDKVKTLMPANCIVENTMVGNELPEMELVPAPVEEKKAEGDASEEMRKCIHKEVLRLAKLSKIKYKNAVDKLRETKLDHDFATELLEQLMNNNTSFFTGENNGDKSETSSIENIEG